MRIRAMFGIGGVAVVAILVCGGLCWAGEPEPELAGKKLSEWVQQLRSDNRGFQIRAARALAEAPEELRAKIIPHVVPLLASDRENDKFVAAQVLGEYGPISRSAVPDLLPLLEGTQFERNRAAAAKALGQILKNAEPSEEVEKVAQRLAAKFNEEYDRYSDVRREAVYALGMIGPAAKKIIPKLTRALTDFKEHSHEHFLVRQAAAWATGRMGPLAAEHIDRLIAMLHAEGRKAPEIVEAIGRIGAVHENVVPNIVDVMERREGIGLQIQAYEALLKCGTRAAPAVPLLARFLRERFLHPRLMVPAIKVLKMLGPLAEGAATEVKEYCNIDAYRCRDNNVRPATPEQVEAIRQLAREALEAITKEKSAAKSEGQEKKPQEE